MGRPPGGRSPPKRAAVIGIKLKPAHKSGYIVKNHKQDQQQKAFTSTVADNLEGYCVVLSF